jgi:hypothetical protein
MSQRCQHNASAGASLRIRNELGDVMSAAIPQTKQIPVCLECVDPRAACNRAGNQTSWNVERRCLSAKLGMRFMFGRGLPVEGDVLCLESHASISVFCNVVGAPVRFTASPRHRFTAEQTGTRNVTNREERKDLQRGNCECTAWCYCRFED